ncbi:YihY/virulence factor BrkB family protein [Knoellia subterranea]|uniref:Membrane protein n=1 Tax=Knoellia subterranea KCTC 19937 TaxID=1385521 RepID=A0A0A0JSI3_9MICO|nr:YihY/virulence factor BrkB family protein [Knoellia subterranea]KGN38571.1 membrane protein [Knoellia subterranea KCTC 19937]
MTDAKRRLRQWLARFPALEALARLTVETIRICLRYRVTGLASEAGFFALLSLPPLVLGLFGGVGYVGRWLGSDTVEEVRSAITEYAARFLTEDVISSTLSPTVNDVFRDGRFDLISAGFVLSLWSGSRALNVLVDTVSIMYGQSGVRGIVQTRALSFSLYVVALLVGVVTIPLVLIGPTLLGDVLPDRLDFLTYLYWPVVSLLVIAGFTSLYHVSTPVRSPWTRDIPGAVLTLLIWVMASFAVRGSIAASLGGTSIYGPLSAPIVLLIWLYMLAIAVLIGAALNAAIRNLWPSDDERGLRTRIADLVVPGRAGVRRSEEASAEMSGGDAEEESSDEDDDLDLRGLRDAARRPLTPISDDETLVIPRIRVGSGR